MKIKTCELKRGALNWAAALAAGYDEGWLRRQLANPNPMTRAIPLFCTDWSQGGWIIERERIYVYPHPDHTTWLASLKGAAYHTESATPLIAAMRCFVASKLGDEVDVPDELSKEN